MKLFKRVFNRGKRDPWKGNQDISERDSQAREYRLAPDLEKNLTAISQACGNSYDLSIRRFLAGQQIPASLVHMDGMINSRSIEEILRTLMFSPTGTELPRDGRKFHDAARERLLTVHEVTEADNLADLFQAISVGQSALLFEGSPKALLCDTKGLQLRSVTEPDAELTLRGPREGFVESIRVNTSMIRRRIRIPHLWVESLSVGKLTRTDVAFAYIKGLATEKLVHEVRTRLERIDIDSILESGYIEDFIEDTPFTIFPLTLRTERPDKVAAGLLEGRVAIFTDGTPHALVVPVEISMLLQAPDDYYEKPPIGSIIRLLRFMALGISLTLPAFYVAVINFHQELLPTTLVLRVAGAREGVPFPVIVEMLIMEVLFEILREAGIRLPAAIGPAISIVGALILGDAAIRAGIVGPAVVIVVALTAIAGFSTPLFSLGISFRVLRFFFTITGAVFGLFGVQFALLLTFIHLCSLRSFGIPYMYPLPPLVLRDMGDNFLRVWRWGMITRPKLLSQEPQRQPHGQDPRPGKDPEKDHREND